MRRTILVLALILAVLAIGLALLIPSLAVPHPREANIRRRLLRGSVIITGIGEKTLTVERGNETIELYAGGSWIYARGDELGVINWSQVTDYISVGENVTIAATVIVRNQSRIPVLLHIEKPDLTLTRLLPRYLHPGVVRRSGLRGFKAVVHYTGEKYMIAEIVKRDLKVLILTGGNWTKAGDGVVSWSEVMEEFNSGDNVWIYGRIAILKMPIAGFKVVVLSRAIINIDSGVSLVRG